MELKRTTETFIILCPLKIKVNQLCTSSLSYLHLKKKKIRERTVTFTIALPSPLFCLSSHMLSLYIIASASANRNTQIYQKAHIRATDIDTDQVISAINPL